MTDSGPEGRHLTRENLIEYLGAGVPTVVRIVGEPTGYLCVDPMVGTLALRFPRGRGGLPDLNPYRHFYATEIWWHERSWYQLDVAADTDLLEAYPVLCAVADRVQLEHRSFAMASVDALEAYRKLLARPGRMTDQEEVGLFGELLVLRHLVRSVGGETALACWTGSIAEEHDFSLAEADFEIKTTTAEARRHWIGDLHQLIASPGRELFLLSIQVTTGGADAATLSNLITQVRDLLTPDTRSMFDSRVQNAGWNQKQGSLHWRRFRLRSSPVAFRVDDGFPALTPSLLSSAGLDITRFPKVTYLLDLVGLESSRPPTELHGFGLEASQT